MQYILKLDNNISLDNYIKDIAKGNMSALEMLYNNTRTIVFGYAFSILKNIFTQRILIEKCVML